MGEGGSRVFAHPTAGCSVELSKYGILQFGPDIKFWLARVPGVGEARPRACPGCGAAGLEDRRVRLQGHGMVIRWVRGVIRDGGEPQDLDVVLRRYRCRDCGAVVRVGPRGLVTHRRYTAPTILFALALWSIAEHPSMAVRRQVSPDRYQGATSAGQVWTTLLRWARTVSHRVPAGGPTCRTRTASALRSVAGLLGGLGLGAPQPDLLFRAGHQVREGILRASES